MRVADIIFKSCMSMIIVLILHPNFDLNGHLKPSSATLKHSGRFQMFFFNLHGQRLQGC